MAGRRAVKAVVATDAGIVDALCRYTFAPRVDIERYVLPRLPPPGNGERRQQRLVSIAHYLTGRLEREYTVRNYCKFGLNELMVRLDHLLEPPRSIFAERVITSHLPSPPPAEARQLPRPDPALFRGRRRKPSPPESAQPLPLIENPLLGTPDAVSMMHLVVAARRITTARRSEIVQALREIMPPPVSEPARYLARATLFYAALNDRPVGFGLSSGVHITTGDPKIPLAKLLEVIKVPGPLVETRGEF